MEENKTTIVQKLLNQVLHSGSVLAMHGHKFIQHGNQLVGNFSWLV